MLTVRQIHLTFRKFARLNPHPSLCTTRCFMPILSDPHTATLDRYYGLMKASEAGSSPPRKRSRRQMMRTCDQCHKRAPGRGLIQSYTHGGASHPQLLCETCSTNGPPAPQPSTPKAGTPGGTEDTDTADTEGGEGEEGDEGDDSDEVGDAPTLPRPRLEGKQLSQPILNNTQQAWVDREAARFIAKDLRRRKHEAAEAAAAAEQTQRLRTPLEMTELPCRKHQIDQTTIDKAGFGHAVFHYHCGCLAGIRDGPGGVDSLGIPNLAPSHSPSGSDNDSGS
jgi:hypothetical protein